MGPYRKIYSRIWNDQKFNALSDDGKLACFLLLTHPHLMLIGAMRATIPGLASELRWFTDRFKNAFDEVETSKIIKHDEYACFMWLPNFIKYNLPTSPNVIRSWAQYLDYLPECTLKAELVQKIKKFVEEYLSEPFQEALPEAFGKDLLNQEQDQYQEQKQKKEITSVGTELPSHLADLVVFLLATGLRKSNVTNLRWTEVDLLKQHALIHPDEAKTKKAIPVPLNETAINVIRKHGKKRLSARE